MSKNIPGMSRMFQEYSIDPRKWPPSYKHLVLYNWRFSRTFGSVDSSRCFVTYGTEILPLYGAVGINRLMNMRSQTESPNETPNQQSHRIRIRKAPDGPHSYYKAYGGPRPRLTCYACSQQDDYLSDKF